MSRESIEKKCECCGYKHKTGIRKYCDTCGKDFGKFPIQVTVHTDSWGNDSIDSYKYLDFCSIECLSKIKDRNIGDASWKFEIEMDGEWVKNILEKLDALS